MTTTVRFVRGAAYGPKTMTVMLKKELSPAAMASLWHRLARRTRARPDWSEAFLADAPGSTLTNGHSRHRSRFIYDIDTASFLLTVKETSPAKPGGTLQFSGQLWDWVNATAPAAKDNPVVRPRPLPGAQNTRQPETSETDETGEMDGVDAAERLGTLALEFDGLQATLDQREAELQEALETIANLEADKTKMEERFVALSLEVKGLRAMATQVQDTLSKSNAQRLDMARREAAQRAASDRRAKSTGRANALNIFSALQLLRGK